VIVFLILESNILKTCRLVTSAKLVPPTYKSVPFECNGKNLLLCFTSNPAEPPILDIQLFSAKNNEKRPESCIPIEGDYGQLGTSGFVVCVRRAPKSPVELTYQAAILDRYPIKDKKHTPLPGEVPIVS
jgi:hypothetical protein